MNFKNKLKRLFDKIFFFLPRWSRPVVVYYHSVNYNGAKSHTTKNFRKQIEWLLSEGYIFKTASELNNSRHNKHICLTFDDGYLDNYEIVLPILKEYKIRATFFIVSNWFDIPQNLRNHSYDLPFMTKKHVKILNESGMEIGCHTHNHFQASETILKSENHFTSEILLSKKILEEITGKPIKVFAYPNGQKGSFNNLTNKIVLSIFDQVFSTIHNSYDFNRRINGRIEMSHLDSLNDFKAKINGKRRYLTVYQRLVSQSKRWYK